MGEVVMMNAWVLQQQYSLAVHVNSSHVQPSSFPILIVVAGCVAAVSTVVAFLMEVGTSWM